MFLKNLTITKGSSVIRDIEFRKGINLIVDESEGQITGNSVGKTTVLKLIDFCFGANKKIIWEDPENPKEEYTLVKDFLIKNDVNISLSLTEDIEDENAEEIVIERNFLARNKTVRRINGEDFTEDGFEEKLRELFFPEHLGAKPSFRQIISHNVRYKDISINNTLKTIDPYTSDVEYEALYLFLFGCEFRQGDTRQKIIEKIRQEETFKKRLEKEQTKSAYEAALSLIDDEIIKLNKKKANLNINENFQADLDKLNHLKYNITRISSEISKLNIRKEIIIDARADLEAGDFKADVQQLRIIYEQASDMLGDLHKSFENLVDYHNNMLQEKKRFITKELPVIEDKIKQAGIKLNSVLRQESELSKLIAKSDTYEDLEAIIDALGENYRKKGEYENVIKQLEEVDGNLKEYNKRLTEIDNELFSGDFESMVKAQINKFNKHFSSVSEFLYGEQYALKYDIVEKKGRKLYKFSAFNTNFSSGKKQGEISCFDIAYTLFADEENIPCMHFLLNDKKELMHGNQLVKIADVVNDKDIQFVASILKDKLPDELNNDEYFIVQLSQKEKLFRIEGK